MKMKGKRRSTFLDQHHDNEIIYGGVHLYLGEYGK